MSADPDDAAAGELTVEVTITPRQARREALVAIPVSVVLLALPFLTGRDLHGLPVLGVIGLVVGVYRAVQAKQQVTRTLIRIDRDGITTEDGVYDVRWNGAALVWVGRPGPPLLNPPRLLIYTRAGVDFARRSRTRLHPVSTFPLPYRLTGADFCARLRRLTDARVVDGEQMSLRDATRGLTG